MPYNIQKLHHKLVYIQWCGTASVDECQQYVADLKHLLDNAHDGLYFISDLRRGRITDMNTLYALSKLAQHPQWRGSVGFSLHPLSQRFAQAYEMMLRKEVTRNQTTLEITGALAFLEGLEPGLTDDIDWQAVLSGKWSSHRHSA